MWPNRIWQINASIWMQEQVRQGKQDNSGIGTANRFFLTPKLDIRRRQRHHRTKPDTDASQAPAVRARLHRSSYFDVLVLDRLQWL